MAGPIRILSGTRSELGRTEVGLANVFERPERPGVLSCLLVAPGREVVMAAGDTVELGDQTFTLLRFERERAGWAAVFEALEPPAPAVEKPLADRFGQRTEFAIAPRTATKLATDLRSFTPRLLAALGAAHREPESWSSTSKDTTHYEWNGAEMGTSTFTRWVAALPEGCEASVVVDVARWSPTEVHRTSVHGHWRCGELTGGLFAGSDGDAAPDRVWLTTHSAGFRDAATELLGGGPPKT